MRSTEALQDNGAVDDAVLVEQRRHRRKPVLWAARIETHDGPCECIILDLSLGGAKLRGSAEVAASEIVTLVIDRFGALRAEVVWSRRNHVGLRFVDTPEQIAHILGPTLPL